MRAEFLLNRRYIQKHFRQAIGIFICVMLLSTAIFSSLLLRDSFLETNHQLWNEAKGTYASTIYQADFQQVQNERDSLLKSGSGIATVTNAVPLEEASVEETPYIGTLDKNTMSMRGIHVEEGRLPSTSGEIAIERDTYDKLQLTAQIGDTVTLSVETNDTTKNQTYQLVGFLSNYVNAWITREQAILVLDDADVILQIPGIITATEESPVLTTIVTCSNKYTGLIKGFTLANLYFNESNPLQNDQKLLINLIIAGVLVFLIIIIIIGIGGIAHLTLEDRKKYVEIMRCIGLTGKQTKRLFLLQGGYLAATSVLASFILGLGVLGVVYGILHAAGQSFVIHITWVPFVLTAVIVFTVILVAFLIQTRKLLKYAPMESKFVKQKKVRKSRFSWKLSVLWGRATAKSHRMQNMLSTILTAGCILLLLLGIFAAVFIPKASYGMTISSNQNIDYNFGFGSAPSAEETFHIVFPRNVGITKKNVQVLRETKGLDVSFAGITLQSKVLAVIPKNTKHLLLKELKKTRLIQNDQTSEVLRQAGAASNSKLAEAPVTGIDAEQLKRFEPYVVSGKIDYEKFSSGEEIIVENDYYKKYGTYAGKTYFHVGDTFTLVIPILPEGSSREKINGTVSTKTYTVRVGAILSSDKRTKEEASLYPFNGTMLMNSDLLLKADPTTRFDSVIAKIQDGVTDSATLKNIHDTIYRIAAQSKGIQVIDLPQYRINLQTETQNLVLLIVFSVVVFLLIITAALFLMTNIKVKMNMRSYILMRAVGLDTKGIRAMVLRENIKSVIRGILIGGILGFGLTGFLAFELSYLKIEDIFLYYMIPSAVIVSALLIAISIVACIIPIKKINRYNIVEKLHEVEY